jgi:hypothetical protein
VMRELPALVAEYEDLYGEPPTNLELRKRLQGRGINARHATVSKALGALGLRKRRNPPGQGLPRQERYATPMDLDDADQARHRAEASHLRDQVDVEVDAQEFRRQLRQASRVELETRAHGYGIDPIPENHEALIEQLVEVNKDFPVIRKGYETLMRDDPGRWQALLAQRRIQPEGKTTDEVLLTLYWQHKKSVGASGTSS